MKRIHIAVGQDRDRCGSLRLFDEKGRLAAGPFTVAARATAELAAAHGNPTRDPLFRYGDPPTGAYRLSGHMPGGRQGLPADEYGPAGVLLLSPTAGDAALAEANGRYTIAITGGELSKTKRLRSTAGGFRLSNADLRSLLRVLGKNFAGTTCQCEIAPISARAPKVELDPGCRQADPVGAADMRMVTTRRQAILAATGAVGAFAARGGITFVAASSFAAPVFAQVASAYPPQGDIQPPDEGSPADISAGLPADAGGVATPVDTAAPAPAITTQIADCLDYVTNNMMEALTSDHLGDEATEELKGALNDKALEVTNEAAGGVVSGTTLPWINTAGIMAGGLAGAAQLYTSGNTTAAVDAMKTTLTDALPEAVSSATGIVLAPIMLSATADIAIGAAITLSLPASALVVTSVVAAVGVTAVVSFGAKKLTQIGIQYVNSRAN